MAANCRHNSISPANLSDECESRDSSPSPAAVDSAPSTSSSGDIDEDQLGTDVYPENPEVPVMGTFLSCAEMRALLRNKHVVVVGDSVQRGVYKDLVLFLQEKRLLTAMELKEKGEDSHCGDVLCYRTELTNHVDFIEVREWQSPDGLHLVQYYFVTRAYNDRVEAMLQEFAREPPDLVLMNSCLWDICRYLDEHEGSEDALELSKADYLQNVGKLCTRLRQLLPPRSQLVWCTALPLASKIVGGFLIEEVQFLESSLRLSMLEANYAVAQVVAAYGFDVLDLHHYMVALIKFRGPDGVHWNAIGHRYITELIASFLYDLWNLQLPPGLRQQFGAIRRQGESISHAWVQAGHLKFGELPPDWVEHQRQLLELAHLQLEPPGSPESDEGIVDDVSPSAQQVTPPPPHFDQLAEFEQLSLSREPF